MPEAPAPAEPAATPAAATPAIAPAAPADSGAPAEKPSESGLAGEAASPAEPAKPPAPLPVAAGCSGNRFDLDTLFASKRCDVSGEALPPPPASSLEATLELGSKTVRPGAPVSVTMRLTNRTTQPLVIDLTVCGDLEVGAYDAADQRADEPSKCTNLGSVCVRRVVRVALDPGGSVSRKFRFQARVQEVVKLCRKRPPGPMDRGTYTLKAQLPLADVGAGSQPNTMTPREVSTELVVQ